MKSKRNEMYNLGDMLYAARTDAQLSQESIAELLDVSKKTISNWESGISLPNLYQTMKWFEVINKDISVYYYKYLVKENHSVEDILIKAIKNLSIEEQQKILFLIIGSHESSVSGVIDIVTAYLHIDKRSKLLLAQQVIDAYNNSLYCDTVNCKSDIMPNIELISEVIEECKNNIYVKK